MNAINRRISVLFNSIAPIISNTVFFSSFNGLYNDNPKQVSLKLHEMNPDIQQIWVQSDSSKEKLPKYIKIVKPDSSEYFKYANRAEVVIENYSGIRCTEFRPVNRFSKVDKWLYRKRKGQLNISTWHGTPLKHIAGDEPSVAEDSIILTSSNYLVAGCELTENALKTSLREIIPVKCYGTPRNDKLVTGVSDVKSIKKRLGIPVESKVFLFAPTFRKDLQLSGIKQMQEMDFKRLFETLNQRFGGDWVFVFRVHNLVLPHLDEKVIPSNYKSKIINGNKCDDMLDYLLCADILLTDYSSSMFDYSLTGKPCFLYVPDLEHYANEERGFYLSIDSLPYPIALSNEQLINNICRFDFGKYQEANATFLKKIKNYEDGNSSMRIVDDIREFMNNN